jgi:hypothetical protein
MTVGATAAQQAAPSQRAASVLRKRDTYQWRTT